MNICWDLRLFSYKYGARGVGSYTKRTAEALYSVCEKHNLYIWGNREKIPDMMAKLPAKWIDYKPSSWKASLLAVPFIILKYRIKLFHYWVALGPIHNIGMGLFHPCRTAAVVYDLGVEFWSESDYLISKKRSVYWLVQKILIRKINNILCISKSTGADLSRINRTIKADILYPAVEAVRYPEVKSRDEYFVALGGAKHKNLSTVVKAFGIFCDKNSRIKLYILGEVEKTSDLVREIDGNRRIIVDSMENYGRHLDRAKGLVFCSLHEGLGMPVIESLEHGCPVIASDIPVLHEICSEAAFYCDPEDPEKIADGMDELIRNNTVWQNRSRSGCEEFAQKAGKYLQREINRYSDMLSR